MSQPEKKLDKFSSAVLKDAQDHREKILAEIEEYRNVQMEKAEEDILHEAYIMIQNEISAIKSQQSRKVSLAELEGRRKFLKQREEIMGRVFQETSARILAYTGTADYATMLCETVKKSCGTLPEGDLVIQVRPTDLPLADRLIKACGRTAKVEGNSSITLGGYILINSDKGVIIDETLDLKLMSQKDWFAASSGLTMGL
jgi:V/A-type H+-transporting ATPase subunit E